MEINGSLYFWGDTHGNWKNLSELIKKHDLNNSNFIQVGDFGLGFKNKLVEKEQLNKISLCLKKTNSRLFVIRGNHDNPNYFKSFKKQEYDNIYFLRDYSILKWNNNNILLVGGATSIDRLEKQADNAWWSNEIFDCNYCLLKEISVDNIDIVVTHTAPKNFNPFVTSQVVLEKAEHDDNLLKDLKKERKDVYDFFKYLHCRYNIKMWVYGHFHFSNTEIISNITTKMLAIDEIYEFRE